MQVPAAALVDVVTALRHVQNFAGAVVSMPHESAIVADLMLRFTGVP